MANLQASGAPDIQHSPIDTVGLSRESTVFTRRKLVTMAAAIALAGVAPAMAHAQSNTSDQRVALASTSSAPAQIKTRAANGEDFSSIENLDAAKQKVEKREWTREDLRGWREWNHAKNEQAAIEDTARIDGKKEAAIARRIEEGKVDQAAIKSEQELIATLDRYIESFQRYHKLRGSPGFNEAQYKETQGILRKILVEGKPPSILPRLEPLRAILMA